MCRASQPRRLSVRLQIRFRMIGNREGGKEKFKFPYSRLAETCRFACRGRFAFHNPSITAIERLTSRLVNAARLPESNRRRDGRASLNELGRRTTAGSLHHSLKCHCLVHRHRIQLAENATSPMEKGQCRCSPIARKSIRSQKAD